MSRIEAGSDSQLLGIGRAPNERIWRGMESGVHGAAQREHDVER